MKSVLIGQDGNGNVHVASGECDKNHEYVRPPFRNMFPSSPQGLGILTRIATNTVHVGNVPITLLDRISVTNTSEGGVQTYTRRMLADQPGFMLAFGNEISDEFRGETYRLTETETPLGIRNEEKFEKKATIYELGYSMVVDGKRVSEGVRFRSPDLPFVTLTTHGLDSGGRTNSSSSIDIVAMGFDPKLLDKVPAPVAPLRFTVKPDPASPFGRANAALLREQGFNDWHVGKLLPRMDNFDSMTNIYHRILPAWQAYQGEASMTNRDGLLSALNWTYRTSMPVTEPQTENLLLDIAASGDTNITVRAMTMLAGFCGSRYSSRLEDYLVQHQLPDVEALDTLAGYFHGNASRVLRGIPCPLASLREHLLLHAEPSVAVTELLRRRQTDARSFNLEQLLGYDDDRVRALLSQLATEPKPEGPGGLLRMTYIIQGLGIYDLPEAEVFLSRTIDEMSTPAADVPGQERDAMFRPMLLTRALQAALDTGRPALRAKVISTIMKDKSTALMLAMMAEDAGGPEALLSIAPHLSATDVKDLLHAEVTTPYGVVAASRQPERFTSLYSQPLLRDLSEVLREFLPSYEAGKDYEEEALVCRKRWYKERKGIKQTEWLNASRRFPKEVITDIIPSYGLDGTQVLLDLGRIEQYRDLALLGLCRSAGDRARLVAEVRRIGRPRDPDHEANPYDIALWVFGDRGVAENMEQYLKYPPNHVGSRLCRYLPWLEREHLIDIAQRRDPIGILRANRPWLVKALSKCRDREAWEVVWQVWEETASPKNNIAYARLFNQAAGRHFGLRRCDMREWIKTLSPPIEGRKTLQNQPVDGTR